MLGSRRFAWRGRHASPAVAVLVLLATASACAPARTPTPVDVTAPSAIKWWTSTEGGPESQQVYTDAQATTIARRFDRILGLKTTFRADGLTPVLRAANPDLELIVYLNGTHMSFNDAVSRPESWFAHDAAGHRVRNVNFDNWVMNIRTPEWADYTAARCLDFKARMGADACYLDDMGAGNLVGNFSGIPLDSTTGQGFTEYGWISATSKLAAAVKSRLPGVKVYANGLNSGTKYFGGPRSDRLLGPLDGVEAEAFVRGSGDGVAAYRNETAWRADVDMLVDAERRGKPVLAKAKLWVSATSAQRKDWREYAFGTFLLGTGGRSSFAFNGRGPGRPEAKTSTESIDLGVPTGDYVTSGGVYLRPWSKGTVFVNPTTRAIPLELGGDYRIGGVVISSVSLGAHRAFFLRDVTKVG